MTASTEPVGLLENWLKRQISESASAWLDEKLALVRQGDAKALMLSFGLAARKVGKHDLTLSQDDLKAADSARTDWNPQLWTTDQSARTLLVLSWPSGSEKEYVQTLDKLFAAGEVGELVALYQALPLYPFPNAHRLRTAEGIRTNMKAVFCAVAHHNPYPAEQLEEVAWNQMILKCLFVGAKLNPVAGLDRRINVDLAKMLRDYAHERWAAKRSVSPELWRPIGPFANDAALADLQKVLREGTMFEQQAAVLALQSCPQDDAKAILQENAELAEQAKQGQFTWQTIATALEEG